MIGFYEDDIKQEIRNAAHSALNFLELNWRVGYIGPNYLGKWGIDFYDSHHHWHGPVSFERPPNANEDWYAREIIKQIQEHLEAINN